MLNWRICILLILLVTPLWARDLPTRLATDIPRVDELGQWVGDLCGKKMAGRRGSSMGAALAAQYTARRFWLSGLRPATKGGSYYQTFPIKKKGDQGLTRNVLGVLPGQRPGVVIVCAHYDHIGFGGGESRSPGCNQIHPGANDNASGVTVLFALARALGRMPVNPGRSILFAAWGAEELGSLGSKWWLAHPTLPLGDVVCLVNLDMVGRCQGKLLAAGVASARGLAAELKGLAGKLEVTPIATSFGGSDHQVFLDKGIPALHLFTGADQTYHTPGDTPERILLPGLRLVAIFSGRLLVHLSRRPDPYPFAKAGIGSLAAMKPPAGPRPAFGSIPDFSQSRGGYLIAGVKPGSPAAQAGLRKGDLIIKFAGVPVDGFQDYVRVLFGKKPGMVVEVTLVRKGELVTSKVKLGVKQATSRRPGHGKK